MGIQVEFNPDLALRAFGTEGRKDEECLPEKLGVGKKYEFLKRGYRNYWLLGEVPLLETKGNQRLSRPLAAVRIFDPTPFVRDGEIWTRGFYRIEEVFDVDSIQIHFEGMDWIGSRKAKSGLDIFVCCSKHFYNKVSDVKRGLEARGHRVTLPNSYDEAFAEERIREEQGDEEHAKWKGAMIKLQDLKVRANDAVLILNFEKSGVPNYIGGATFLEIFRAWELGKKIFLYNPIPEGMLRDELKGFQPIILNGDLSLIK